MTAAGVSLLGAQTMAQALVGSTGSATSLAASKVVQGVTGGELMAEFLVDWKVPYVFGLAGSEEVGFLDALVDRMELNY